MTTIKPGQVWRPKYRHTERHIEIKELLPEKPDRCAVVKNLANGRTTRISLEAFHEGRYVRV